MQVQSVSAVTNPISVQRKLQEQPQQSAQQNGQQNREVSDKFVRTQDGRWVSKSIDENGNVVTNITRVNWGPTGVLESVDTLSINNKIPTIGKRTVVDYEHNGVSHGVVTNPLSPRDSVNETLVTERKDLITGKTVAKQTYTMSEVLGIYNVTETDALGRTKVISSAHKTADGGIYISKNMTSLDGTTTTYRYMKSGDGNHIRMYNQIADKYGNALSTVDRTYDRKDENHARSSINGRYYTIEQKGKDTVITDEFKGETTVLNEKMFKVPTYKKPLVWALGAVQGFKPEKTREPVISELLHTLPGDTLIDMSKDVRYIIPLKDDLDSAFLGYYGHLNCKTDEFVVSHELGHAKDAYLKDEYKEMNAKIAEAKENGEKAPEYLQNPIADNPEFQKAYFNEKAMFLKAFPDFQEEYIDYFIFETDGQSDRGRKETVAETNAINSQKPMPVEILAMRTQVLQQYFPRTLAVATKLTTPIAIPEKHILLA